MRDFRIDVPQTELDKIRAKVAAYEWHEMPANGGWAYGASLPYMQELATYWAKSYDWRQAEAQLNAYPQFLSDETVDGETIPIHFYHVRSPNPQAQPLILSHGWPGSVFEFLHLIDKLTNPAAHGGEAADAFHLVIPSIPGYGFSGKPRNPISPRRVARYFASLMASLGYTDYIAQGGDWGSTISGWLAHDHPGCKAGHVNMYGWRLPDVIPETEEEKAFAEHAGAAFELENAYFRLQSTKPQSLSYAMMDSPVGVAAWIVEKFNTWSDTNGDDIESVYTKDQLLTNIMIYLVTRSFNTATWLYRGLFEDPGGDDLPPLARIEKPMGVANFPGDFIGWPPKSMVERTMNVVHWTDIGEGGHFAALEKPDLFIEDVRRFARSLK